MPETDPAPAAPDTVSGAPEFHPIKLAAWLDAYPSQASVELARALIDALSRLQDAKLNLQGRHAALVMLSSRAEPVLAALDEVYRNAPQPMDGPAREALALARALSLALARGFKTAAVDKTANANATSVPAKAAPLVLKAMEYVAAAMRDGYKTYSKVPEGAWRELHQLYLLAEQKRIATGAASAESGMSITDFYAECLLLSLADPYRLPPGEMEAVIVLARELRAALALGREPPETRSASHFLACDGDAPPRPLRELKEQEFGPDLRVFDASAAVNGLRAFKEGLAEADERAALAVKLIALWEDPPKRVFHREPAQGSVAICVGVKPIAHFVAHDATTDGEAETKALREGITMPLRALPEDESGKAIPIHEWAVINLSAGGARVRRSASTSYPITVGEVLGIRAPGKVLWTIGVTRWITGLEDGTTEFGVQFFAHAICAVWVKDASASGTRRLGLLVAQGEDNSDESLLTPPGTYSELGEFELRGEGFRSRVRAARLIEKNARFELFHVVAS